MWPLLRVTRSLALPAAVLCAVLTVSPGADARPVPAQRAGAAVTVANFAFTPKVVRVGLGGLVTWTFPEAMDHTSTSNAGFWDSGLRSHGATFGHAFATAGTFGYHCRIHTFMHGRVVAPMTASGSATQGWHLRWAASMPSGYSVDVQVRRPGSTAWTALRTGTTRLGAAYHPAKSGQYALRARSHRKAHVSSWTPVVTIQVS